MRMVVKGQFPVSDRDFISYTSFSMPDTNVSLSLTKTVITLVFDAADFDYPKNSKAVRGEIEISGLICKRVNANETDFIQVVSSDPKIKGVPQSIIRSKSRASAFAPLLMVDAAKKEKKNKK